MSLDSRKRSETWSRLEAEEYDVLVIGGGITGAGIALDAISRGLTVALVEMQDYGAGTSSRSTKLIHGGLRYLKQWEFRLVREVGRERAILFENAPHIVVPEQMLLPVVKGGTYGKLGVSFGLWLYDRMAGVEKEERRKMLSVEETLKEEPLLKRAGLKGSGLYHEYRTDDARLVIEVMKTAVGQGAVALNYAKVSELRYKDGKVCGAVVQDMLSDTRIDLNARIVVNAAGPWVDSIRNMDGSLEKKRLHHTKGIHLVVEHKKFPVKHSVYFDIGDGRMMFAIPRGVWTYFGTTDTTYKGDLEQPPITRADVDYLMKAVQEMFPGVALKDGDIKSSWAGIRPLIHEEGKSPSELSRKDEIFYSDTGLLTIAGGKLTGFRKMAERVTDVVMKRLVKAGVYKKEISCKTANIQLSGGDFENRQEIESFINTLSDNYSLKKEEVVWLVSLYGSNSGKILVNALSGRKVERDAMVREALRYSVMEEGACTMSDFFVRRTALLYFGRPWIAPVRELVETTLKELMGGEAEVDPKGTFAMEYEAVVDFG